MITALTNHLWQSTLFAGAAAIAAWALGRNGAHVRHIVWMAASAKFLVPFSLLISAGHWLPATAPLPTMHADSVPARQNLALVVDQIAEPFARVFSAPTAAEPSASRIDSITIALGGIWLCGAMAIGLSWFRTWRRVRSALRIGTPVDLGGEIPTRAAPGLVEPGVVGVWRPVLLVPAGLERHLTRRQLDAVIAHEECHVRRRDNLTATVHMVVECVFWFHPIVWWIGARLVDERERACDEHVLRVCGEPEVYAESILNVCKLYVESPLACVSGVTGADIKRRVAAIVVNRIGLDLTIGRKVALTAAAALAIAVPLAAGVLTSTLHATGQGATARFDVVSIKLCDPKAPLPVRDPASPAGTRSGIAPWAARTSPGYVLWACVTLSQLIEQAYADADHPLLNTFAQSPTMSKLPKHVRGGPEWVETDKFTIEATAPVDVTNPALSGAPFRGLSSLPPTMSRALQVMLEDRFQLKVHRATEEAEVYAMTVAKSGVNKATMKTPVAGDCLTIAQYSAAVAQNPSTDPRICGRIFNRPRGGSEFSSVTMPTLAAYLAGVVDRFVVNRTDLNGMYNFELFATTSLIRQTGSGDGGTADERVNRELQNLGLRIDLVKAPVEYLAIDRVERPRPNTPAQVVAPLATADSASAPAGTVALIPAHRPCRTSTSARC